MIKLMRPSLYLFWMLSLLFGYAVSFAQPLNLQLQLVDETFDGMPSRYIELTGRDFKGKRYPVGLWTVAADRPSDASIRFIHRFQPELVMDFAVFVSAELLRDYTEANLKQYVSSLQPLYARQGMQVEGAKAVKAPVGSAPFMGGTYWKINYNLVKSDTGELLRSVTEFVSVDEDSRNYRLRFSGPATLFRQFERNFPAEVGRFTLD